MNKLTVLLMVILLTVLFFGGWFFLKLFSRSSSVPSPSPVSSAVVSPSPVAPLIRSDWSFEVLNGSPTRGLAKKIAEKIGNLGYQVVKVGNADKSDYSKTEILVKKNLLSKTDLVIADLADAIKIASMAGELTEGTASARIIIGKDAI